MPNVEGEIRSGSLMGYKTNRPKYNAKGERTADASITVVLEFQSSPGLAAHLTTLLEQDGPVDTMIEANQRGLFSDAPGSALDAVKNLNRDGLTVSVERAEA